MNDPLPPDNLHSRKPLLLEIPTGQEMHRFHNAEFSPIFYDKSLNGRFNASDGTYGVLYAAKTAQGAFAETFLRSPGRTLLDTGLLRQKAYVSLVGSRTLKLIQLAGPGLARIGATAQVTHCGLPYDLPQTWSSALAKHSVLADGIAYTSRHDDNELCFAVFDRAAGVISEKSQRRDLDQNWFWELAAPYGVGLAPDK